jgi:ribonuclease HII
MTWCVGIDEAGRGPVVGPLVVGICALPESDLPLLREQGVRDSKDLSPKKRAAIEAWFMQESEERGWFGEVVMLSAERIDLAMQGSGLNLLEVEGFQEALHLLPRRSNLQVMADACDVDADRFARRIVAGLNEWPWPESQVKAEHKADEGHLIVGMASILAKEARERAVAAIEARIGKPIGSGYPSDRVTKDALPFLCRPEGLDEDLRWGWATVERFWKANHAGEVPKRGQPRSVQQTLFEADRPRIS